MFFARRIATPSAPRAPRRRRAARPVCEPVERRRLLAAAPAGVALDTAYGQGGRIEVPVTLDAAYDAAALPSGKMVIAGSAGTAPPFAAAALVRLNPDGTRDASFDGDGVAMLPPPQEGQFVAWHAVLPLDGGKLLAAGDGAWQLTDGNWDYRAVLARYNEDGTLDPTFGAPGQPGPAGVVVLDPGESRSFARDLALLPGGKILLGGHVQDAPPSDRPDIALWRFNPDGSPDATFGNAGFRRQDIEGEDYVFSLAALPDGTFFAETSRGVVAFNPDGTMRGAVGPVRTPIMPTTPDGVMSATPDGKLMVVTAGADPLAPGGLTARRYLADGTLDPSFGSDPGGGTTFEPGTRYPTPGSVHVRPDGSVIVGLWDGEAHRGVVTRLNPAGSLDTNFGVGGRLLLPFDHYVPILVSTAAGGRVFAAGDVGGGPLDVSAYRLDPGIVADPGGPYGPVDEGGTFTASAAGSSAGPGDEIVKYEWDFDYNGVSFSTSAEGETATVRVRDDSPPPNLMLRVTTSDGLQATSARPAEVAVRNVAPPLPDVRVPTAVPLGVQTAVVGSGAIDPGSDVVTVTVDFGDGTPPVQVTPSPGGGFSTPGHAYAARGTYRVRVTASDGEGGSTTVEREIVVADVVGNVFRDADDTGRRLPTSEPVVGVTVYVDTDGDGTLDEGEPRALTDSAGFYSFRNLDKGTYFVRVEPPIGFRANVPRGQEGAVVVDDDGPGAVRDFGLTDRARITGVVFDDRDADGVRDAGEAALVGAVPQSVYLDLDNDGWYDAGEPRSPAGPASHDRYLFANLAPGTYTVRYLPVLSTMSIYREAAQTFPNERGGQTAHTVTVAAGQVSGGNDFGSHFANSPITGTVYLDRNRDGDRGAVNTAEVALPDRVVFVDHDGDGALDPDESRSVTNDPRIGSGYFLPTLPGRTYTVRTIVPDGWTQSEPAGGNGTPYVLTADGTVSLQNKDFGTHLIAAPAVVGRHLFYFRSAFSGTHPVHPENDAAIAPDKAALLPGQTATFANVSSYNLGLNGVMVDLNDLSRVGNPAVLQFAVGDGTTQPPTGWTPINPSMGVEIRRGAGVGGSDRMVAVFATDAIRNKWLRVTVLPGTGSGLSRPDVFYFGHLQGETGAGDPFKVNALDIAALKRNLTTETVGAGSPYDINRDFRVNALDLAALKANLIRSLVAFTPTPPPAPAPAPSATAWLAASEDEA